MATLPRGNRGPKIGIRQRGTTYVRTTQRSYSKSPYVLKKKTVHTECIYHQAGRCVFIGKDEHGCDNCITKTIYTEEGFKNG